MSYVLILGAKSDIAKAVARIYAQNGYDLFLASRNSDDLDTFRKDIEVRYEINVKLLEFDALKFDSHQVFYDSIVPKPLGVICFIGYLGNQEKALGDFKEAQKIIETNYTGCVSILNIIANDYAKQKNGFIIGISSVAGDRGRKSNYIYGSAKAAFTAYLSGLRNRLHDTSIQVLTVKPGFVNTQMTKGKNLPKKLTAQPEEVARQIYKSHLKGKNVLYTKRVWRYIMMIINLMPEKVFKRMNL
ncbi:MAG: SDR family oxidoreductase [Candidatus Marinimicrobia bacterium]|nr:SDR family oxidoreductase [Candidatus Neomarinimicrobiota bacterium]